MKIKALPLLVAISSLLQLNLFAGYGTCPTGWTTYPPPPNCNVGGGGPGGFGGGSCGSAKCNVGASQAASHGQESLAYYSGMPVWQIRKSDADFRLFDIPLKYQPAYGPAISLDLVYRTFVPTDFGGYVPNTDANPLFGPQWHCAWSSDWPCPDCVDRRCVLLGVKKFQKMR